MPFFKRRVYLCGFGMRKRCIPETLVSQARRGANFCTYRIRQGKVERSKMAPIMRSSMERN